MALHFTLFRDSGNLNCLVNIVVWSLHLIDEIACILQAIRNARSENSLRLQINLDETDRNCTSSYKKNRHASHRMATRATRYVGISLLFRSLSYLFVLESKKKQKVKLKKRLTKVIKIINIVFYCLIP